MFTYIMAFFSAYGMKFAHKIRHLELLVVEICNTRYFGSHVRCHSAD